MKKSKIVETHKPCPKCKSSDAYCTYDDGHGYCFSCTKYFKPDGDEAISENNPNAEYKFHAHRGISDKTFEFYNVYTEFVNDRPTRVGFIYPNNAVKFRSYDKKEFLSEGPMSEAGCFGTDKFDAGGKETIIITEGEYDALAVYEITRGSAAVVSVRSASSAKKDCTRDYQFINSFRRIVIAFDGDDAGISAAKSVSSLFDFSKVYWARPTRFKDANEYLQASAADEYQKLIENARRYAPDNIMSTYDEFAKSLVQVDNDVLATYPSAELQTRLYGMHRGEVIVFKGPEGIGKTEIFRWLEHHILKTTKCKIGILHLEEDNGTTVKALAGYQLKAPAVLPDSNVTNEEVIKAIKKLTGGSEERVHIHSAFDVEDESSFLDNIRFLVSAAGCDFIFLDHISWLATGQDDDDERKKLDRLSQRFKLLAKELRFCMIMISHVNDEGKTRGSRNITKVANTVIHLNRDLISGNETDRNTTYLIVEKARLGGKTGPAGSLVFDTDSYTLREKEREDEIKIPNLGN
ncbi:MAG: toprim domain-containing protein [Acinetobacter sp.]|uniref:bifunctional DNA primase/helicase n=1 Tax=Acinetobacter sp. TaxID=472 RepID=UPI000FBC5DA6|nr:bifunctional DNA primase/helicase [Acinetobacter sp.]RUP39313.1 MAG: toprim domain-containing protein [Acinetobacter sp.]